LVSPASNCIDRILSSRSRPTYGLQSGFAPGLACLGARRSRGMPFLLNAGTPLKFRQGAKLSTIETSGVADKKLGIDGRRMDGSAKLVADTHGRGRNSIRVGSCEGPTSFWRSRKTRKQLHERQRVYICWSRTWVASTTPQLSERASAQDTTQ
jgi:hypothetical protein